jgi:hypothetical protein
LQVAGLRYRLTEPKAVGVDWRCRQPIPFKTGGAAALGPLVQIAVRSGISVMAACLSRLQPTSGFVFDPLVGFGPVGKVVDLGCPASIPSHIDGPTLAMFILASLKLSF